MLNTSQSSHSSTKTFLKDKNISFVNGDDKLGDVSVRMSELAEKEKLIDKKNNGGKSGVHTKNDVQKQSLASQMKKKVGSDCIKLKIELEIEN